MTKQCLRTVNGILLDVTQLGITLHMLLSLCIINIPNDAQSLWENCDVRHDMEWKSPNFPYVRWGINMV